MTLPEVALRQLTRAEVERRAGELVMLQRAAYALEAELIGDDRIPQLSETPEELAMAGLTWNVGEAGGLVVAAIAHSETSEGIDIERLVVHPSWHRRGLGRQLVTRIIRGFATVSTGTKNQPARRLYESMGFRHVRDDEVLPGLWVTTYEHG
jgi:GNAT superfamily N-acetyltransferase